MSEFLDRISRLSPQRLALLADELNQRLRALEDSRRVPLAIVGIGCNFPGGVHDPESFWHLLRDGVDAVKEVPASRWNMEEVYSGKLDVPGTMSTRCCGFIDAPEYFDAKFFGIAPAEALSMDPQQRMLLECSWQALEHAGIPPARLAGTPTGVFVGICNSDYGQLAMNAPREEITPYFASGLSHAIAAGRISYVLGLRGPALAVDTSCSASLMAVHLACQSLRQGECETALAGGVNLVLNPEVTIALSQGRMMAPDGRCKAFSDAADGFVRSEGCGMIVLKRLPDAERDGNRILAVIRGSAANQDGRSSGLTAPNGPSQEAVIVSALANAGLHPEDVDCVEAHGTGTALGDPIEAGALNAVFGSAPRNRPLFLGSVKTNLGHLESAAGIAGLIKLVLSIQHGELPPSLHFNRPNPRIDWEALPLRIPATRQNWPRNGKTRIGGVSSFGFSGTNVHVIVEEYAGDPVASSTDNSPRLYVLSARTPSALSEMARRLQRRVRENPELALSDVAHTLNTGRSCFEHRAAMVAATREELLRNLASMESDRTSSGVLTGRASGRSPRVAFLFPEGISAASCNPLVQQSTVFRNAVQQCIAVLPPGDRAPLRPVMSPEQWLLETHDAASVFAAQYALASLWQACGIQPAAMFGIGIGEWVAASIAGSLRLEDALRLALAASGNSAADFETMARQVENSDPRVPVLAAPAGAGRTLAISSPELLQKLAAEECSAVILMGSLPDEQHCAESSRGNFPGILVSSLNASRAADASGDADTSPNLVHLLQAMAALFVHGCDVNAGPLHSSPGKLISLPTYPFEKERYWLDEIVSIRRVANASGSNPSLASSPSHVIGKVSASDAEASSATHPENWIYELAWEPQPLPPQGDSSTAIDFDSVVQSEPSMAAATPELHRTAQAAAMLQALCPALILSALQQASPSPLSQSAWTLDQCAAQLQVIPARTRLLERLLGILTEDGLVERSPDGRYRFLPQPLAPDPDAQLTELARTYPETSIEIDMLRRCIQKLPQVLQGACDPMQLVFAGGSLGQIEQIYENSPVCRYFNARTAALIRAAAEAIEPRPLRVLEIGGGTGATTGPVLAALQGKNFEYCFTDISPVFLARARTKFASMSSLTYRLLDIEKDPARQGFSGEQFDVVLAANVLHATADLRQSIAHARQLLAPGGLLLLVEGVRPDRWLDLTLGLTDGWWRFQDFDLRPEHPLISADAWKAVFRDAGIPTASSLGYRLQEGTTSQQMVLVAQAPSPVPQKNTPASQRHWMILADHSGVGDALHRSLSGLGQHSSILYREQAPDIAHLFRNTESDAGAHVVYLWPLDVEDRSPEDAMTEGAEICTNTLLHTMQAMQRVPGGSLDLTIVTRGAQATPSVAPSTAGAVQSLAWGIGRVFGLESPELYGRLVDLDPSMSTPAAASALLAELEAAGKEDQVAYRNGQRCVARLRGSHLAAPPTRPSRLRHDGAYLLVGGLGGVGLRVARWAAERGAGHIVLLGRTGIGGSAGPHAAERISAIREIEALGATVTVVEGDAATESCMQALFARFGSELPPLRGVIHAATIVDSAEIADLTPERVNAMLRVKVQGTWALHRWTQSQPLDFFLAFSSITSLIGARAMAPYAAANQFLDAFAHTRRAMGLPMTSIDWGSWDVLRLVSAQAQNQFAEIGMLPMPSQTALSFLDSLIVSSQAQVTIARIDWSKLKPLYEMRRARPWLQQVGGSLPSANASRRPSQAAPVHLPALHAMNAENRRKSIQSFVLDQAARVLGFPPGQFPAADVPLIDAGLDSLMAVDLKNRLQQGLGRELSPTIVFDYPSVSAMAEMLDTLLWAADSAAREDVPLAHQEEIRL